MIDGATLSSTARAHAEADRDFFRDTLGFPSVIFRSRMVRSSPCRSAESAFHPADENGRHELYLMCGDLNAEMAALRAKGEIKTRK